MVRAATTVWRGPSDTVFAGEVVLNQTRGGSKENVGKFICHPYPFRSFFFAGDLFFVFLFSWPFSLLSVERGV
jgi:hypothetical protein